MIINYTEKKNIYPCIIINLNCSCSRMHVARMMRLCCCELIDIYVWIMVRLGVEAAKVEVGFERLTVEADVRVASALCDTAHQLQRQSPPR